MRKLTSLVLTLVLVFIPLLSLVLNSLTTPTKVFASHSRVNLGNADNFAILAGSAISDTGTTSINGDVGLSPAGGASITGLTCSEVTGTIYDNDGGYTGGGGASTACRTTNSGLLIDAKLSLTSAYNDAAGRTTTSTVGTELGGTTLTDGTYDSAAGTFGITGTLTLDGQGNTDAVFIFKMASTLITASSSRVVLINGAQACNVYWQVGSSATLGTSTTLVGNVLALTSITDNGSSLVNGRLLARNGATTLNNTTVVKQTCATGTAGGPTAAPTSASGSSGGSSSGGSAGTVVCPTLVTTSPIIIESKRISPTSIFINWGPYQGANAFIVQYGVENGKWLYSSNVTGFSATLNGLPSNQPIWVHVAARNSCSAGNYGQAILVGGPMLPSTGIVPEKNNTPWYIPVGILVGIPGLLFLIQKKRKSSYMQ